MNKKLLLISVATLFMAIILMTSVAFAWLAISDRTNTSFIFPVGDLTTQYEFGEVVNENQIYDQGEAQYEDLFVSPGNSYVFLLSLVNDSTTPSTVSAYFSNIASQLDASLNKTFEEIGEGARIQYLYSYKVTQVYWNPNRIRIFSDSEGGVVTYPDEEKIASLGLIPFTDAEIQANGFNEMKYFNSLESNNYYLVNNFILDSSTSTSHKSSIVLFFEIYANAEPSLPTGVTSVPSHNCYYENQYFYIDNLMILTNKDE